MGLQLLLMFLLLQKKVTVCEAKENPRYRILQALFGNNNSYTLTRDVIPLPTEKKSAINVHFEFDVHQILELNEKKQVMKLNIWLRMKWQNIFLQWNPDDYDGIKKITVDKEKVWVPDLTLWNRAVNDDSIYQRIDTRIIVEHDGKCSWYGPATTSSTCAIRVQYFPFDNQTCKLNFGSWRHTTEELVFSSCQKTCADKRYFKPNSEWSLEYIYGEIKNHTLHTGEYSVIECRLEVSRKSLFYVMNMVVPCTIIAVLCCLTFYLPANNGERTSLVITVLLAMTVYMLVVAESMPPTSEAMPLVQKFYLITIVETALCLFATCVVIKWHENKEPMPDWVYLVFNCFLRKVLQVKYTKHNPGKEQNYSPRKYPARRENSSSSSRHNSRKSRNSSDTSEVFALRHYSFAIQEKVPGVTVPSLSEDITTPDVSADCSEIAEVPRDWKLAARVLNKLFLITFTAIFVFSIGIIFGGMKSLF